jgi:hypothetical protein
MVSRREEAREVRSLSEVSGERSGVGRDQGGQAATVPRSPTLGMKIEEPLGVLRLFQGRIGREHGDPAE